MRLLGPLAVLLLPTFGAQALAQATLSREERAAITDPPESVFNRTDVKGVLDQLDPEIWVTTKPFATKEFTDDKFLRANIDKSSGHVFYQIYIQMRSSQSLRLDRMTYLIGGKLKTAKVSQIYLDVDCQRYGCSYFADYVVEISRDDLQSLASEASGGFWRARLFGQTVDGIDFEFLANETAGFLSTMDRVIATLPSSAKD